MDISKIELEQIKDELNSSKTISWKNKKCPICEKGKIKHFNSIGDHSYIKNYKCNKCKARFIPEGEKFILSTIITNPDDELQKYAKIPLSKREWIEIAYMLPSDNEKAMEIINEKKNQFDTDNTAKLNDNKINVSFYESMPGRISLKNNKDFIQGILEMGDREIIIHKKTLFRGKDRGIKHLRYNKITSIDYDAGKSLSNPSIQLYFSNIEYTFMSVDPRLKSFYNKIREKIDENDQKSGNTELSYSPMDELKKLAELKDLGIVTEEEFELKKKKLLEL